jgi:hypothetical protein
MNHEGSKIAAMGADGIAGGWIVAICRVDEQVWESDDCRRTAGTT